MPSSTRTARTKLTALAGLVLVATLGISSPALAAPASYARNGAPTPTSISTRGPEAVTRVPVTRKEAGTFAGGQLFFPTRTQGRTVGAVVLAPGLEGTAATLDAYGPALASQGFVVLTMDTLSPDDASDQRAAQILQAVQFVKRTPVLKGRVDPSRIAVGGFSLGGGAAVAVGVSHPEIRAAVGLAPFYLDQQGSSTLPKATSTTPTLIVTGAKDDVATPRYNGRAMYDGLGARTARQYLELRDAVHESFLEPDADTIGATVAFLKRHLDGDTRYTRFICPAPVRPSLAVSLSRCGG